MIAIVAAVLTVLLAAPTSVAAPLVGDPDLPRPILTQAGYSYDRASEHEPVHVPTFATEQAGNGRAARQGVVSLAAGGFGGGPAAIRLAAKGADAGSSLVSRTVEKSRAWLRPDARAVTNEAGDKIFISKDGLRRIRVDIQKPYPHQSPHAHVEEMVNGKWVESGPIYHSDVAPR